MKYLFIGVGFFVLVLVSLMAIDKGFGLDEERKIYREKCKSLGGFVFKLRDEPKRCMKKDVFIDMEKNK